MQDIRYIKMEGLVNDFLILDARDRSIKLDQEQVRQLSSRENASTNGCDQLIVLEPSNDADVHMRIYNASGEEVDACGNASRAVAHLLLHELHRADVTIATNVALLDAHIRQDGMVQVDMGVPGTDWQAIPLSSIENTNAVELSVGPLEHGVATNMGNPHITFFVEDAEAIDLERYGPAVQANALFPEGVNVGIASKRGDDHFRLRVYERGVGETAACGTGACAAAVAAHRRRLAGRDIRLTLNGGDIHIVWGDDNRVRMAGPVGYPEGKNWKQLDLSGV